MVRYVFRKELRADLWKRIEYQSLRKKISDNTYTEVWVTSVRTADGETAKLRECDEAEVVRRNALVPLGEGVERVRDGICDNNCREGERDGEVQELHDALGLLPLINSCCMLKF